MGAGADADAAAGDAVDPVEALLERLALDVPNCPRCLLAMEVDETAGGAPFWSCAACGSARVA